MSAVPNIERNTEDTNIMTANQLSALSTIVAAGTTGTFATPKDAAALAKLGYIEVNKDSKDANGNVAVRATPTGVEATSKPAEVKVAGNTKPVAIVMGTEVIEMPEIVAGKSGKPEVYPFDALVQPTLDANGKAVYGAGTYFFVEGKDAKNLASTVSSAIRRYSIDDPSGKTRKSRKPGTEGAEITAKIATRKFQVFDATQNGKQGARVFRTDVATV